MKHSISFSAAAQIAERSERELIGRARQILGLREMMQDDDDEASVENYIVAVYDMADYIEANNLDESALVDNLREAGRVVSRSQRNLVFA